MSLLRWLASPAPSWLRSRDPPGVSPAALLAFASALLIAARDLVGRDVPARIPVMVVTFATNVMVMVVAAAMSVGFESWRAPTGWHVAFLGFAGLFVTLGHVGLLLAYRLGRTAAVAPFFYSFALWAVLSGASRLRRPAECSCACGDRADRRQRRRHRAPRPAPRRGDRPYRGAMTEVAPDALSALTGTSPQLRPRSGSGRPPKRSGHARARRRGPREAGRK